MLTVSSSIEISSEGKPLLKAGTFSIPEGYQATNLIFKYFDPVNNSSITKLSSNNIFNTETKTTLKQGGEIKTIPAGNYQLKITGEIGTCAILVYDIEPIPQK